MPNAPDPVGAYVAFKKIGNLLFISGQLPISKDGEMIKGKIGADLDLEDGQRASKLCAINIIAQAKKACDDDLNQINESTNSDDEDLNKDSLYNDAVGLAKSTKKLSIKFSIICSSLKSIFHPLF